jgi:hypothetical protein
MFETELFNHIFRASFGVELAPLDQAPARKSAMLMMNGSTARPRRLMFFTESSADFSHSA